jgi:hypothetical protein
MFGLARQTSAGLSRVFGAHVDTSDLAALLTDGFRASERARAAAEQERKRRVAAQEALRVVEDSAGRATAAADAAHARVEKLHTRIAALEEQIAAAEEEATKSKGTKGKSKAEVAPDTGVSAAREELERARGEELEAQQALEDAHVRSRAASDALDDARSRHARDADARSAASSRRQKPEEERCMRLYDASLRFDLDAIRTLLSADDRRPFDCAMTTLWESPKARSKRSGDL